MNIEERLARIEERIAWLQRHTTEQDRIISDQTFEIESLKKRIFHLKQQLQENPDGHHEPGERPPHY